MTISLKANAAGTQGEVLLNGTPVQTFNQNLQTFSGNVLAGATQSSDPAALTRRDYVDSFNDQTWQAVSGRTQGTPYTNNTGRTIDVAITFSSTPGSTATITVGGLDILFPSCPAGGVFTGVIFSVPKGAVYFINFSATTTINKWVELR